MCQVRPPPSEYAFLKSVLGGGRKEGMTRGQRGPLMPWATHVIQWRVQWVAKARAGANPIKARPSSDWSLQLDSMKLESLVSANQLCCAEYVLESCTHRPSRQKSRKQAKAAVRRINLGSVIGTKSNTASYAGNRIVKSN